MASGGREPLKIAEELGTDGKYTGTRGLQSTGIGDFFQGVGPSGTPIWVRDVGDDPPYGQGPREFPAHSCQANYEETSKYMGVW